MLNLLKNKGVSKVVVIATIYRCFLPPTVVNLNIKHL